MGDTFAITRTSRDILSKFLENLTLEQLNKVPAGFNNNIFWNIAHIVVVQQMLVYNLSGLPMVVSKEMVDSYKRGTKPEHNATQDDVNSIKALLRSTIDQTEKDFATGIFKNYNEFTTMTGFNLKSAEEAMAVNYYHEAVHTGVIMSLRKFV